ncbi:sugar transferase [Micromonospora sp. WMMD1102]|uniref:sugar transferase n=1 Tax=Micromonospora sp. WMMD1102 TaxID=3016105 RepID=UPI0024153A5F|nr:sugar transferase [Micromonospora sp. WMMD1102]MDG4786396.1 sugar transferase [Micromonospora sp. WMMD1102]
MSLGRRRYDRSKRVLDAVVAAAMLLLLAPVIVAVAGAVVLALGRPVLFRQVRPGRHGRPFVLYKFRTMHAVGPGRVGDAERLTRLGSWLRATSLDELPTLWNVCRGDMSLVGPRPLLPTYLDRYTPQQARRHEVRPGITGLAQVNGRNAISWEERFSHDVWYVDRRCLGLDLRILLKTVARVLRRHGITAEGDATMPEFLGTRRTLVGAGRAGPGPEVRR